MSVSLKKLKRQLISINLKSNKDIFIKTLDGLYQMDFKRNYDDIKVPISEAPEGIEVVDIEANIKNIIVCGGLGYETVIVVDDL